MIEKDKAASPIGVGVLTILTVLLVLALAVFSVLTFSSAKADLALSEINADTVGAYYEADTKARESKEAFMAGTEAEYEETIPMTETQSLYIHLRREPDGSCAVLAWKTISAVEEGEEMFLDPLPVWDGELPA